MLQRLLIALAWVKADQTSENLLNGIRQIIYSLYLAIESIKKVYNNVMNSVKVSILSVLQFSRFQGYNEFN